MALPVHTVDAVASPAVLPRRLVCVAFNAAVDKTAAVDRLVPGEIHRPELLSVVPGGKTINVARAAMTLGMPVTVVPVVGGHAGAWLEEALAAEGLASRPVRVPGESRTCLSVLDRSTGLLTEFYEPGLVLDADGWSAVETAVAAELEADPAGTVVVISGSLPGRATDDAGANLVRLVGRLGGRCAVDLGGRPLALAVEAGPWLVKVNAAEAADAAGLATGGEPEAVAAARVLRAMGAAEVVVTMGMLGSVVLGSDGKAWRIGPAPEHGPYAVGSGDSMLGGILAALATGATVREAARHGSAAATANALQPGQGHVDPADVARVLPIITLTEIAPMNTLPNPSKEVPC
jgi:tagatose 6-phosphate kinase